MDFITYQNSLTLNAPPAHVSVYLQSLWYDAKGNWRKAHELIENLPDKNAAWIHAYLHRKEGDFWNADYWYKRAGEKRPEVSLEEEWKQLVHAFLR